MSASVDSTASTLPILPKLIQNDTQCYSDASTAPDTPIRCSATPVPEPAAPRLLSTRQLNAIPLILAGQSDQDVATAVGVTRVSICRWRNQHPRFIAELNRQRHLLHADTLHRYDQTLNRALTYIQEYQSYYDNDLEDQKDLALQLLRLSGRRTLSPATTTPPLPTDPDEIALQLLSQGQDLSPDDSPADDAPPPPPKKPRK